MPENKKKNLFDFTIEDLKTFFSENGQKEFRAKQVHEWLWKRGARSFNEMTNLSKELRQLLEATFSIPAMKTEHFQQSADDTLKFAFRLHDEHFIEGVLIPSRERTTACISSQVGCPLNCQFCATAKLGWVRNLEYHEIFDQVFIINKWSEKEFGKPLSNVVLMGMGEPLLNYDNVKKAISLITGDQGMGMSPSRITLSTVGLVDGIKKMADDKVKFKLAVSLHTAIEEKRNKIIPANKSNPLHQLKEALRYFHRMTDSRITFEYLLLKNINDSLKDAEELAKFCRIVPCKVNLIEYNEVEELDFKRASKERTHEFLKFLESKNMVVNLRQSRGHDIDAACGQLANKI